MNVTEVDLSGQERTGPDIFSAKKCLTVFLIHKEGGNTSGRAEKWKMKNLKHCGANHQAADLQLVSLRKFNRLRLPLIVSSNYSEGIQCAW